MIAGTIKYILFAIDYGIPFFTDKREDMFTISIRIKKMPSPIVRFSLDVLPAAVKFNYKVLEEVSTYHHEWTLEGMERFWDCIGHDAVVIDFDQTFKAIRYKECLFGTLHVIDPSGKVINVNDKLIDNDVALRPKDSDDFLKRFLATNTPKTEKWNDCFRSGGILKNKMGFLGVPNFDKIFDKIMFPPTREVSLRLKQINEKVMDWMNCNEGFEKECPMDFTEFEEKTDSEYLFELYNTESEICRIETTKADEDEEMQEESLTREQIRRELEKLNLKEQSKEKKITLYKEPVAAPEFLPVGYQLQVAIQGMPATFKVNYNDEEFISVSNHDVDSEDAAVTGSADVEDNNYEKWS